MTKYILIFVGLCAIQPSFAQPPVEVKVNIIGNSLNSIFGGDSVHIMKIFTNCDTCQFYFLESSWQIKYPNSEWMNFAPSKSTSNCMRIGGYYGFDNNSIDTIHSTDFLNTFDFFLQNPGYLEVSKSNSIEVSVRKVFKLHPNNFQSEEFTYSNVLNIELPLISDEDFEVFTEIAPYLSTIENLGDLYSVFGYSLYYSEDMESVISILNTHPDCTLYWIKVVHDIGNLIEMREQNPSLATIEEIQTQCDALRNFDIDLVDYHIKEYCE